MSAEWFVLKAGERRGPVRSQQLKTSASTGQLQPDQKARKWTEGMAVTAKRIKGLFRVVAVPDVNPLPEEWYYAVDNECHDPVSASELRYLAVRGTTKQTTLVWKVGMKDWQKVGDLLP